MWLIRTLKIKYYNYYIRRYPDSSLTRKIRLLMTRKFNLYDSQNRNVEIETLFPTLDEYNTFLKSTLNVDMTTEYCFVLINNRANGLSRTNVNKWGTINDILIDKPNEQYVNWLELTLKLVERYDELLAHDTSGKCVSNSTKLKRYIINIESIINILLDHTND